MSRVSECSMFSRLMVNPSKAKSWLACLHAKGDVGANPTSLCSLIFILFITAQIVPLPNSHAKVLIPSRSECDLIWKQALYRGYINFNEVKLRSLVWALLQHSWCLYKWDSLHTDKNTGKIVWRPREGTDPLLRASEATQPAGSSPSTPSLQIRYCVTAAPGKEHTILQMLP